MAPATADPKVLTRVKSITTKAINAAAVEHAKGMGGDVNRSTATRSAYKIKAEALDEIAALLGSKAKTPATAAKANGATARPPRASTSRAKANVAPRPKGTTARATKKGARRSR